MRTRRIRMRGEGAVYHLFSRVAGTKEDRPFGDVEKEKLVPAFQKGGTPTSNLGGSNVAVTEQAKHPEAAIAYALFTCASIEGQVIMAEMGTFPSHLPTLQDPQIKDVQMGVYGDQKVYVPFIELTPLVPETYWRDSAFPEADVIVNSFLAFELPIMKHRMGDLFPKFVEQFRDDPDGADAHDRAQRIDQIFKEIPAWADEQVVPSDSLMREFIGGSVLSY